MKIVYLNIIFIFFFLIFLFFSLCYYYYGTVILRAERRGFDGESRWAAACMLFFSFGRTKTKAEQSERSKTSLFFCVQQQQQQKSIGQKKAGFSSPVLRHTSHPSSGCVVLQSTNLGQNGGETKDANFGFTSCWAVRATALRLLSSQSAPWLSAESRQNSCARHTSPALSKSAYAVWP